MKRVGEFLITQANKVLENKQYAILLAMLLSVLPFASWLSVSLVALMTLRRGPVAGFEILMPALVIHSVPLMMMLPVDSALINTCLTYLPCYLAAVVLRKTGNWQWVAGVFLSQALIGVVLMQAFAPQVVMDQFSQFKEILSQYQEYQQVLEAKTGMSTLVMAQLFFSVQLLSIVVSACISLVFARSIQAKLFVPGGLRRELRAFRSGKLALIPLLALAVAAYYYVNPIAINLLPLVLVYFLLSGFNLMYFLLARKRQIRVATLLIVLVLLKPSIVLSAYIILGSLDSVFNFRLFLPTRLKESI